MTTEQYQTKLKEKRKEIINWVLNEYSLKEKELLLKGLLLKNLNKYSFLRDLDSMEVYFKNVFRSSFKGNTEVLK